MELTWGKGGRRGEGVGEKERTIEPVVLGQGEKRRRRREIFNRKKKTSWNHRKLGKKLF
ncbi:unnamed protein product [Meloidogyne enterolobii]|uniref:Uncharacterized protein n=1 Tax=Meloidogyne enterolobii TaxID=390850 RepID=A0ACB0ZHC4_MELEN